MNSVEKILFFFVLPVLAILLYPPQMIFSGISSIVIIALTTVALVLLGLALLRGRSLALTFSIFLQGLNVIIRIMMIFPFANKRDGSLDVVYVVTILLGLAISFYLMMYMDGRKVRAIMLS